VAIPGLEQVRNETREYRHYGFLAYIRLLEGPKAIEKRRQRTQGRGRDCSSGEGLTWPKVAAAEYRSKAAARQRRYNLRPPLCDSAMSRLLITLGIILVAIGLAWPLLARLGLGHLPGDIRIERDDFTLFIPLTSGLLVSVVVSLILWLLHK
jgi:hypothetical protein